MKHNQFFPTQPAADTLSRRNFLRLTAASLLGLVWPRRITKFQSSLGNQEGRIIGKEVLIYAQPSLSSMEVNRYWQDTIVPITHVTIGDAEPAYNRVWYRIGEDGFAHSGLIQPVQTILNEPIADLPKSGALAEVTVPYTDAHYNPIRTSGVAYRFYYETTHWVDKLVKDSNDTLWYRVREDKWDLIFYVLAHHLRILSADDLAPLSPDVPAGAKRIEINLDKQTVTAFEWDRPVFVTRAATGAEFSNGKFLTPRGRTSTYHKRPSRHMAAGDLASNGFDLPGVPWVCYLTDKGVAIHGTFWHNDFGRPRSHGCINLTCQASKWIYRWTLPTVPLAEERIYEEFGTTVDII
jgi:lipoprotein-anchoring transpeptidase ErfK/SrfK